MPRLRELLGAGILGVGVDESNLRLLLREDETVLLPLLEARNLEVALDLCLLRLRLHFDHLRVVLLLHLLVQDTALVLELLEPKVEILLLELLCSAEVGNVLPHLREALRELHVRDEDGVEIDAQGLELVVQVAQHRVAKLALDVENLGVVHLAHQHPDRLVRGGTQVLIEAEHAEVVHEAIRVAYAEHERDVHLYPNVVFRRNARDRRIVRHRLPRH
mmetsp:Transcript_23039/g.75104  ORF Transcript_23039/g.75104 Transcript_23039/m.75104 type:complete len:218 (-) Transcript_23039:291-944(-)